MKNLLKEAEAAAFLRLQASTLRQWRNLGRGPNYFRVGGAIRYDQEALETFLVNNKSPHDKRKS